VTNLWPLFNQWKSLVVNELINMNQYSTQIELYDYSGYSLYHCERIPPMGDLLSTTQWYWEAGHFKKELGDIILEEVLRSNETILSKVMSMNYSQTSFGIRLLDQNSFLLNQNRIIQQRLMCESNYPELFTDAAILARASQ
jgi:E3 ubiquitin-protein ligase DOA10